MYYIVESNKSFDQASTDLASAVTRQGLECCMSTTWGLHFAVKAWPLMKNARSLKSVIPGRLQKFCPSICV